MECKGAIFDMDGLLFDTERIYQQTWQELAEEKGVELGCDFIRAISGTGEGSASLSADFVSGRKEAVGWKLEA